MRHSLFSLACLALALSACDVSARCPPTQGEASHRAAGRLVFTGRAVTQAPRAGSGAASIFPAWTEFVSSEGAEGRIRVYSPDQAIYTAQFVIGRSYRIVATRTERGLETSACVVRQL